MSTDVDMFAALVLPTVDTNSSLNTKLLASFIHNFSLLLQLSIAGMVLASCHHHEELTSHYLVGSLWRHFAATSLIPLLLDSYPLR